MRNARFRITVIGPVLTVGLMVASVSLAGPVTAQSPDVPPSREYGESGTRTGIVTVRAGSEWLPVGGGSGSGGSSSCITGSVRLIVEDDFVQPVNREWRVFGADGSIPFTASPTDLPSNLPTYMRNFSPTGRWFAVSCNGVTTVVPEGGPAVTIDALMRQAVNQLDPPEPDLAVTPAAMHFTQLQSWLAIDPAYWSADRRATAAAGRVAVTATVTPVEAVWDMGNGESVDCAGPGTVWRAGLGNDATDCAYTYRESSAGAPGHAFDISATVRFEVGVTTNAPGTYGPFADLERTTTESIQVGEIQAVNN